MKTKKMVFSKTGTLLSPNSGADADQKKKVFPKNGTLFYRNSSGHLRSDAHQRQIIGGDADVDHTQSIGGDTVKLLRGIYPPIPLGFRHPWRQQMRK